MRRRKLTLLAALGAAAIAALLIARPWSAKAPPADRAAGSTTAAAVPAIRAGSASAIGAPLPSDLPELVAYLRARFGKHIASRYAQIQMIEKLMRHFQAKNPAGWQAELLAAVRAAFPERYAEIAAT